MVVGTDTIPLLRNFRAKLERFGFQPTVYGKHDEVMERRTADGRRKLVEHRQLNGGLQVFYLELSTNSDTLYAGQVRLTEDLISVTPDGQETLAHIYNSD